MRVRNSSEQLAFLRLANPTAAFAALFSDFSAAVKEDHEMAQAFARFQKNFNGKINTSEDAFRIDALKTQGADSLGIKIGALPLTFSAGLAFIYDTAVEGLRSSHNRIDPGIFSARGIRTVERLLEPALLQIGSRSVTALELALRDRGYADRLRQRASELGGMINVVNLAPPTGPCEFCTVSIEDNLGNVDFICPTEEACANIGIVIIVVILISLLAGLIDWLW